MELQDFIPPFISKILPITPKVSMREYASFESVLNDSDTYEDRDIIEVVSRKTRAYRDSLSSYTGRIVKNRQTAQNLFALSYVEPHHPISVLELGGACGATYFELNHLLPGRIGRWSVVETPSMAAAGREVFQGHNLKFYDDLNAAALELEDKDLIVAQGVLQYSRDPLQVLDYLLSLRFKFIYATRTVVNVNATNGGEKPVITKQVTNLSAHGPGAFPRELKDRKTTQPLTLIPYASLFSQISADAQPLFWFDESENRRLLVGSKTFIVKDVGVLAAKAAY